MIERASVCRACDDSYHDPIPHSPSNTFHSTNLWQVTGQELWNLTTSEVTPLFTPSLTFPSSSVLLGMGGAWSGAALIATPGAFFRYRQLQA